MVLLLPPPSFRSSQVRLDPSGLYAATCSFDKWVRIIDFFSGDCVAKAFGHSELVTGCAFTADGRRLVTVGVRVSPTLRIVLCVSLQPYV